MDFPVSADDSYYNYLKSIEDDQLSVDCPKYFYADRDEAAMDGKIWVADGVQLSNTVFEPEPISKFSTIQEEGVAAGGRFNSVEVSESDPVLKVSLKGKRTKRPRGSWGESCKSNKFYDSAFRQYPIANNFQRLHTEPSEVDRGSMHQVSKRCSTPGDKRPSGLPEDWIMISKTRQNGASAGVVDKVKN